MNTVPTPRTPFLAERRLKKLVLAGLLILAVSRCPAQIELGPADVRSGTYVYELAPDPGAYDKAASDWNNAFEGCGTNVRAGYSLDIGNIPVIYVTNQNRNETTMEMVMTFDFSASGQLATEAEGVHWIQSFSAEDVQPYYQRFYSINGGKDVLIDQSPSWGQFPNDGDANATGFYRLLQLGGEGGGSLSFPEPARTFTYKIVVKFQNRRTGDEEEIPLRTVQVLRGVGDPSVKREPFTITFSTVPAKK